MLTILSKGLLTFPLLVLIVAIFHLANGGSINPELTFVFMCAFFAIITKLLTVVFGLFERVANDLLELASDIDEKDDDEIFACLHDEEDIKGFLQDLENEIIRSIEARKDRE